MVQMTGGRSRAAAAAAALLLVLSLSACASGGGGGGSKVEGKTITIGISGVLSGEFSAYKQFSDAAQIYFKTVNAAGGVNGHTVKVDLTDNAFSASRAVTQVRTFANENVLEAIVATTPPLLAVKGIANQLQGLPILGAGDGAIFTPPVANLFGNGPSYQGLARADAAFIMNKLNTKDFALAYSPDIGQAISNSLPAFVQKNGGGLQANVPVDEAATDFTPMATKLKNSGAKTVLAFIATAGFAGLQKAAASIGYHPTWVTMFVNLGPAYTSLVGNLADGVYVDSFQYTSGPAYDEFVAAMKKYDPQLQNSFLAETGWTLGAVTVAALKAQAKTGKPLTRASYLQALQSLHGVPAGLLPSVTYDGDTHAPSTEAAMLRYVGGQAKQVAPFAPLPAT